MVPLNLPVPAVWEASSAMAKFKNTGAAVERPSTTRPGDSVRAVATLHELMAATFAAAVALAVDCCQVASVLVRVEPVEAVTVPRALTPVKASMMVPVTPRVNVPLTDVPKEQMAPWGMV